MIERRDLEVALGRALCLISDATLARKVVDCWMLGLEEGGWKTMAELSAMPFTLVAETKGLTFLEHTLAVTLGAVGLAKGQMEAYARMPYAIDMDRLVAGGLLHDVGKLLEIERRPDGTFGKSRGGKLARHPISGAILAARAGLSPEVVNIVACHAKEGEGAPQVVETVLVHQADFATFDPLVMQAKGNLVT
jgi:putative nucleotidyltransferase with HDIG domain